MVIGSAQRRQNAWLWVLSMLVDVGVAGISARFFDQENWLITTFWVWLAIQVVGVLFMILGVVRLFVIRWVGGFKPVKNGFLTALEAHSFPAPEPYVDSVDDYLIAITQNENETIQTRLAAASLFGGREGIKIMAGFIRGMMINSAQEEALKEYAAQRAASR